jgi:hypothetical protein
MLLDSGSIENSNIDSEKTIDRTIEEKKFKEGFIKKYHLILTEKKQVFV